MNISGLDKAEVLATLFNASRTAGTAALNPKAYDCMTKDQAEAILAEGQTYFDYLNGRVMKIDLSSDEVSTRLYNRDNGENAAENAIAKLRS